MIINLAQVSAMKLRDILLSLILVVLFLGTLWYVQRTPSNPQVNTTATRYDSVLTTKAYATAYAFQTLTSAATEEP